MTLLFCDGFEQYADIGDWQRAAGWSNGSSGGITGFSTGRYGGQRIDLHGANMQIRHPMAEGVGVEFFVGVAVNWTGASIQVHDIFRFMAVDSEQLTLEITVAGELRVNRLGSQLAITSGLGLTTGVWYYIEFHVVIDDTVGEYEVRVNETVHIGPVTGADTNVNGPNITHIELWQQLTSDPSYDDFYICNAAGLTNNDFLGDITVETLFPQADGNRNDMTRVGGGLNNFEAVDDGSTPDDDTTYVHGNVVGDDELYDFDTLTGNGFQIDTIHAVGVTSHYRQAEAGARTVRALARSNVTEVEGGDLGCGSEYRFSQHIYETDPDGGGAWDEAAVNAAEFGITIQS
jgi:hypothetical protein